MSKFTREDFERLSEQVEKGWLVQSDGFDAEEFPIAAAALRIAVRAMDREKIAGVLDGVATASPSAKIAHHLYYEEAIRQADALIAMFTEDTDARS